MRRGWWFWVALLMITGCTRKHYLRKADRETYRVLEEKTQSTPWKLPPRFTILPQPGARFFDPTKPWDPLLPIPAPQLYAFHLDELPERDQARFRPQETGSDAGKPGDPGAPGLYGMEERTDQEESAEGGIRLVGFQEEGQSGGPGQPEGEELLPPPEEEAESALRVQPIPREVWESLPPSCLRRMLEFRSIRDEYRRSYGKEPGQELRDQSPRFALEDIVDSALVNSREYQTQKEILYSVALRLTLARFQYDLKFTPLNNGSTVDYIHNRTRGETVNTLRIPTQFNADKILASGGDILARLANNVVLTFNGPDDFVLDVGSELFFNISQNVFQREIVLEPVTQAERDVVYASRDFAQFRKAFFSNLANQYYNLINNYRDIEIAAQDYFSNLRAFYQQEAVFRIRGRGSRLEVAMIEQQVLASRSSLITTCDTLERGLDALKLAMGIPPELAINLNLTELEELTSRDEAIVATELVRRAQRNLRQEREKREPDRASLLNASIRLTRRLLDRLKVRERLGKGTGSRATLRDLLAALLVDEAAVNVEFNRRILAERKREVPPPPPELIFERTVALIDAVQQLIHLRLNLASRQKVDPARVAELRQKREGIKRRLEKVREDLDQAVRDRALDRIPQLVKDAEAVLMAVDAVDREAAALLGRPRLTPEQQLQKALQQAESLLAESEKALGEESAGLVPIKLDMDDGMLTALVRRFDLMNQRGILADTWRAIQLAGDDLKSILNLNGTQVVRTKDNKPLAFTFDESQTQLTLVFDAPFNRKAQRNAFRQSLINYQGALRDLIALADTIKVAIRNDLRDLQLDRQLYENAVAGAALAYERVLATQLQLQLGAENITARDFVEAQQAYTRSVSDVADQHINYIQDRITLFLNLELLEVDDNGFWPELYNEQVQPTPSYQLPLVPPYGTLPQHLWYSHKVKRMLHIPPGLSSIHVQDTAVDEEGSPEPIPVEPKRIDDKGDER
jgi:hypothetical protein